MLRTSDRLESDTFMLSSLLYIVLTVDYNFKKPYYEPACRYFLNFMASWHNFAKHVVGDYSQTVVSS